MFQFYQKNDQLRITDLHQGIVWGTNTPQTIKDERLINRFDYDGDYGTVLNRFLMQGAMGVPLTVYGTGGQTRAFIHVTDTARCIEIAINNPPKKGERVEIFNQVAETRRVRDIAGMVAERTGVEMKMVPNPRQEAAENELDVSNKKVREAKRGAKRSHRLFCNHRNNVHPSSSLRSSQFCNLGLEPLTLDEGLFDEVTEVVQKYKHRCDPKMILPASYWNKARADECKKMPKVEEYTKDMK
jgi:UDP-sulfoquinovose synthase